MILIHFMAILGYCWHPNLHKTKEKFTNLSEAERKKLLSKARQEFSVCDKTILSRETKTHWIMQGHYILQYVLPINIMIKDMSDIYSTE